MPVSGTRIQALLVDDDAEIGILLSRYLEKFDIDCIAVQDGDAMREQLSTQSFDVILLDIMLPGDDGITLLREMQSRQHIPVIMLTARGEPTDRILGLESGADDYVIKPFDTRELVARIHSLLRRTHIEKERSRITEAQEIRFKGWKLHCVTRELRSPEQLVIPLSNTEFKLLKAFLVHPNQILTRDQLLDLAVGKNNVVMDRSIDLMVSRLRQKLGEDPKQPELLKTVRGEGYLFSSGKVTV